MHRLEMLIKVMYFHACPSEYASMKYMTFFGVYQSILI